MENIREKLLLIGCGKLGTVFLKTWLCHKTFSEIVVVQPSLDSEKSFKEDASLTFVKKPMEIPADFKPEVVVIAVKPHQVLGLLGEYARYKNSALFVSLATGISLKDCEEKLGGGAHVVRLMPNIAVEVGQSVNLACGLESLDSKYKNLTEKIFAATGKLVWLDSEELIDQLTPISGSGPAYFFLLAEILADSILRHGIDKETSLAIANQVLLGSALLTTENPDLSALRSSVTSKGGVTEAALKILQPRLKNLVEEALKAAMDRIGELKQ